MGKMMKVQILGFVVMMLAVPIALFNEGIAFIVFGIGVALFIAGLVLGFIFISLPIFATKDKECE